jgi:ABC-type uncharacterized transport system substrate-binding protein
LIETLREGGAEVVVVAARDAAAVAHAGAKSAIVATVGATALREAIRGTDRPIVAAMCLRSQVERETVAAAPGRRVAGVALDVPLAAVAQQVRQLFPKVRRMGVLRRGGEGAGLQSLQAEAAAFEMRVELAECDGPADLVAAFLSLTGRADVVWCPADETLYSATTVKPLMLASLHHRLATVGFSEGIVRAGAVAGVMPVYEAIGERAARMALARPEGAGAWRLEGPPELHVWVNRRVLRILGLDYDAPKRGDGDVEIID